jgi:predicted transcriptional regulator
MSELIGGLVRRPAVWVDPDATLRQLAGLFAAEVIGAALVRGHQDIAGIVSERDVVRSLAEGEDPSRTRVRDVMTEDVLAVPASMPVARAVRMLLDAEVRHLVVEAGDGPVHVVSMRDLVAALHGSIAAGTEVAR